MTLPAPSRFGGTASHINNPTIKQIAMQIIERLDPAGPGIKFIRAHRLPYIREDGRVWLIGGKLIASDAFLAPWLSRSSRVGSLKDTVLDMLAFKGQLRLVVGPHSGQVGGPTRWPVELPLRYALGRIQYVANDVRAFPAVLPLVRKRAGGGVMKVMVGGIEVELEVPEGHIVTDAVVAVVTEDIESHDSAIVYGAPGPTRWHSMLGMVTAVSDQLRGIGECDDMGDDD